jgi:hypothetical protein
MRRNNERKRMETKRKEREKLQRGEEEERRWLMF